MRLPTIGSNDKRKGMRWTRRSIEYKVQRLGVALLATVLLGSSLGGVAAVASEPEWSDATSSSGQGGAEDRVSSNVISLINFQSQTDWYINDDPTLFGPSQHWYAGTAGDGYGSNNFRWTYAIGGEASADNWAHWYMGDRVGRQTISVYVPSNQATATVRYHIYKDNSYFTQASIAQAGVSGWTTLGTWDFGNADVLIAVLDNAAVQHYNTHGYSASRIGVDAIAMRCVSNCTSVSPPGQVDFNTVDYVVDNASSGAGRVTWGSVLEATSYDVELEVGTERVSDGTKSEDTHSLQDRGCCEVSLRANTGYRIIAVGVRVRAVNSAGSGLWSVGIIRGISYPVDPPPAVTGLSFASGRISWNEAARATAYDVEWTQEGEPAQSLVASCCSLDITYVAHKDIHYRVRGKNKNGTQFGPWTSWHIHEGEEEPVQPPASAPSGFAWIPGDSVWSGRLTWNAESDAIAYDVDWRNEGGATTRQTVQCVSSCGLGLTREPQKDLWFRVRALNEGGSGPWSAWQVEGAAVQLPGVVTGLAYSGGRLRWNRATSATAERYDVAYKLGGESSHHMARDVSCCELALSRPTGGSVRVAVSAVNSAGRGPWTPWTTVVSADRPAKVTGLRYSGGVVRWDAAENARFYAVAYQHGSDDYEIAENVACCQMRLSQVAGKSLKVNIQGRTAERLGEWSGWKTLAEAPKPGAVSGVRYSNGKIVWQPATNADWYRVLWRIGGVEHKAGNVKCCSHTIGSVDSTLRVALRGENQGGAGPWFGWKTVAGDDTDTSDRDPPSDRDDDSPSCPTENKYEVVETGGVVVLGKRIGGHLRIRASQTFHTINGKKIRKGEYGGKVWGTGALSQDGCSWIFFSGEVNDQAKVKGNAEVYGQLNDIAVVKENAAIGKTGKVGDESEVSGGKIYGTVADRATVEGCAVIHKGAVVGGYAKISEAAEVWGRVKGQWTTVRSNTSCDALENRSPSSSLTRAVIPKGAVIDSGDWNGSDEYRRGARKWRMEVQRALYDEFKDCILFTERGLKETILRYIGADYNASYAEDPEVYFGQCRYFTLLQRIVEEFKPNAWDIFFSVGIGTAKLLRLGTAAKVFLEILEPMKGIASVFKSGCEAFPHESVCEVAKELKGEVEKLKSVGWLE